MSQEKYIRGKKDSKKHEGRRSAVRRFQESEVRLKEYMSNEHAVHAPEFRVNEEWQAYKGVEYRYPSQFGEALLVEGVNCTQEEADALKERGAIFPIQIGEPMRATFYTDRGDIFLAGTEPRTPIHGLSEPLTHGLDR